MAVGTIKTMRGDKGFGFIKRDGGQMGSGDLFFHQSSVQEGNFDSLREGQRVSFDEERDPRDPSRFRANNVRVISASDDNSAADTDDA
jgi:CspA family cold shock protein